MELSKSFAILRSMVFVIVLTIVLTFVPIAYGDLRTSLIVSVLTFLLSLIISGVLTFFLGRS